MGLGFEQIGAGNLGSYGGPDLSRSLGDFNFRIKNTYNEASLKVSVDVPEEGAFIGWAGRIRILRKQGEYPLGAFDSTSHLIADEAYTEAGTHEFTDPGLSPGETYYYALYEFRVDSAWVHDSAKGRVSSYPIKNHGMPELLYSLLPAGWRSEDNRNGKDLLAFTRLLGFLLDGVKTDAEYLLTLCSADSIPEELIPLLDSRIGWPTWLQANGLRKRQNTLAAVPWYKIKGRADGYEALLSEVFQWDVEVVEGWRYVFYSNGKYMSTTPDFANGNGAILRAKKGTKEDELKYTNDTVGWHGLTGLGLLIHEVPGVSLVFLDEAMDRALFLINKYAASYANFEFMLFPVIATEESITVEEEYSPLEDEIGLLAEVLPEDSSWAETPDASMFLSTTAASVTTDTGWRTYHEEIVYI